MFVHCVAYSARNFAKLFFSDILEHRVAYSANSSFSDVTKLRNAGLPLANGMESNGLILFSRIREREEQGLRHLFISPSSSDFINKTDLKPYLFKNLPDKKQLTCV